MDKPLECLAAADRRQLIELWVNTFRCSPPPNTSQDMMRLMIGWEIQSKGARSHVRALKSALRSLGNSGSSTNKEKVVIKRKAVLSSGTRLSRDWQGRTYTVDVLDKGYAYEGKLFTSLTPIAKAITGSHRSGPLFFGVSK